MGIIMKQKKPLSPEEFNERTAVFHRELVTVIKQLIKKHDATDGTVFYSASAFLGNLIRLSVAEYGQGTDDEKMRDLMGMIDVMAAHAGLNLAVGGVVENAAGEVEMIRPETGAPVDRRKMN